jgi:hypothetical protein
MCAGWARRVQVEPRNLLALIEAGARDAGARMLAWPLPSSWPSRTAGESTGRQALRSDPGSSPARRTAGIRRSNRGIPHSLCSRTPQRPLTLTHPCPRALALGGVDVARLPRLLQRRALRVLRHSRGATRRAREERTNNTATWRAGAMVGKRERLHSDDGALDLASVLCLATRTNYGKEPGVRRAKIMGQACTAPHTDPAKWALLHHRSYIHPFMANPPSHVAIATLTLTLTSPPPYLPLKAPAQSSRHAGRQSHLRLSVERSALHRAPAVHPQRSRQALHLHRLARRNRVCVIRCALAGGGRCNLVRPASASLGMLACASPIGEARAPSAPAKLRNATQHPTSCGGWALLRPPLPCTHVDGFSFSISIVLNTDRASAICSSGSLQWATSVVLLAAILVK